MRRLLAALALCLVSGCYRLGSKDIFEMPFQPITPAALAGLSDAQHVLRPLRVAIGRPVSAYWDDGDGARGVLVFFDGNGYGAEAALRRLLVPARALHLDLVVFNYFDEHQNRPSMSEMRQIGDALFDAAQAMPVVGPRAVYVAGHSLGATLALMTAVDRPAAGVFLAAPATSGVAMLHHQMPLTRLLWLRPDDDYRQFDNLRLAPRIAEPTLVVGSDGDSALPPVFTNAVYDALPATTTKRELILHGVPHSGYFAQDAFWTAVHDFFHLSGREPFVGYIPPRPS